MFSSMARAHSSCKMQSRGNSADAHVLQVGVLILGAGPTGLGAATRLNQHGHDDWMVVDQVSTRWDCLRTPGMDMPPLGAAQGVDAGFREAAE